MVATGEFTYKDAIVAGCFEKDTYLGIILILLLNLQLLIQLNMLLLLKVINLELEILVDL